MATRFPRDPNKWNAFESQTFLDSAKHTMTLAQFEELAISIRHAGEAGEILQSKTEHEAIVETAKFMKQSDPQLFMKIVKRIDTFRRRLDKSAREK